MNHPLRLLARVSEPTDEPVSLSEAKLFLRVEHVADDALIADLITAARSMAEEYMRLSFITQSWKIAFDDCLADDTFLPRGPVQSITSVTAYNESEVANPISGEVYRLNASQDRLQLDGLIYSNRVEVVYVTGCGYGATASAVPKPVKLGMLTHIAAMYDLRDGAAKMPLSTQGLYSAYRGVRL